MKYVLVLLLIGLTPTSIAYAVDLPASLQGLGLRESATASRDLPGWQRPDKIVVRSVFGQDAIDQLQGVAPDVKLVPVETVAEAAQKIPNAQALIGFCQQEIFSAAKSLQWVQVYTAGVDDCVSLPGMRGGQLLLSNGQRLHGPTIGDHAIALSYALVRGLDTYHSNQIEAKWGPQAAASTHNFGELSGRTMLVVGLGGIGTQVAQRAHALGMRILATRGSRREGPDYVEYVGLADEAIKLAPQADIVVNAAPLTDSTRGMFNEAFFKAMKPSAYFISVGRGQSTVTADLLSALRDKQIAGAGLDVTDPEPLPAGHPLWTTPRVIITPHIAARSAETYARVWALTVENVRRYVAGEPLLSVVDVERGY